MSKPLTQPKRRTYFNNPLIRESLEHLPAAVEHGNTESFKALLRERLHYSSENTRKRYAEYIAERFALDGAMNQGLARFLRHFGSERAGREVLCFELARSAPLYQEASSLWLAEQPAEGTPRPSLLEFLDARLQGRNSDKVGEALVRAWRDLGKLKSPKLAVYAPLWGEPPLEAFLYVLTVLYPERAMVRVDSLASQPVLRALLWPRTCVEPLLQRALEAGHLSKISELDQYHQFTLEGSGAERLDRLVGAPPGPSATKPRRKPKVAA